MKIHNAWMSLMFLIYFSCIYLFILLSVSFHLESLLFSNIFIFYDFSSLLSLFSISGSSIY